jgi:hypothetical protein
MRRLFRIQLIALFFVIAFYTVYAFASSETNQFPTGGEGASAISGWRESNVQYLLGDNSSKTSAVEFNLDSPADLVQVSLDSSKSAFFTCENRSGTHWFCNIHSQVSVAGANEFRVVAIGN